jgi:hypothetical protein
MFPMHYIQKTADPGSIHCYNRATTSPTPKILQKSFDVQIFENKNNLLHKMILDT